MKANISNKNVELWKFIPQYKKSLLNKDLYNGNKIEFSRKINSLK